jgi:hypothetical protein
MEGSPEHGAQLRLQQLVMFAIDPSAAVTEEGVRLARKIEEWQFLITANIKCPE